MKKILYIVVGGVVGAFFSVLYYFGFFSGPENFLQDLLFHPRPVSPEIVVVAIDNESIEKIGQWPWPREVYTQALNNLSKSPPLAVALDITLSEPSSRGENDDAALRDSFSGAGFKVILATEAEGLDITGWPVAYDFLKPLPQFTELSQVSVGHVNVVQDRDGVVRRIPPQVKIADQTINSLAYESISRVFGSDFIQDTLPLERIVYAGEANTVRHIPFWRLYEDDVDLFGKILFIGATAPDLHDFKNVPFGRYLPMSGVELQAQTANMFLNKFRLREVNQKYVWLWIFLAGLLPGLFFTVFRRLLDAVVLTVFLGAAYLLAVVLLFESGWIINILHLSLSWVFSLIFLFFLRYFLVEKEKTMLKKVFSRYVSKEVVEQILENPKNIRLGGEEKEITVFFSDIRSFTTLSEKMPATELVELLNKYFSLMTESVLRHGGVLDKYIGDAIMAFWGAPIPSQNQADDALLASMEMLKNLDKFNKQLQDKGLPPINIGIGIYTGSAVVGNMGSDLRMDYTATGDTVNVASRLEGLNKQFNTRIIFGENTKNKLKGEYKIKSLGEENVKGRAEPVKIYTLENI